MRRRGIVGVEIPNQNLRGVCVRQESCHAAIWRRELLKLRRRNRAAVAGRMANRCFSGRTANRKKWVIEKKPGEQKTRKNLPQRDSTAPHCVAREAHCSWFGTSTPSLTTRWANRMHSVFVFVKFLPELEKKIHWKPLGALVAGTRVANPLWTTRVQSPRAALYAQRAARQQFMRGTGRSAGCPRAILTLLARKINGTQIRRGCCRVRPDRFQHSLLAHYRRHALTKLMRTVAHVFVESLRRARKEISLSHSQTTAWGRRGIIARGAIIPVVGSYTEV